MERRPQKLVDELRRAIAQTPDSAEQKALYEKLGLLELELAELARRERRFHEADAQLARARGVQFGWRVVIGILVAALIGATLWLAASLLHLA